LYALSGGATDKFGNRYEGRWTVACMIEVIDERAGFYTSRTTRQREGVEFWLAKGDMNITRLKGSRALLDVRRYLT